MVYTYSFHLQHSQYLHIIRYRSNLPADLGHSTNVEVRFTYKSGILHADFPKALDCGLECLPCSLGFAHGSRDILLFDCICDDLHRKFVLRDRWECGS